MRGILPDANIDGVWTVLYRRLVGKRWREVWLSFDLEIETFASFQLPRNTSDAVVWQLCQDQGLCLITANRNENAPDSLEATIRARNSATSLPVLTVADYWRILKSKSYAERVTVSLLQYLLDMDHLLGTGPLYLP
jgi:hypothetical protein